MDAFGIWNYLRKLAICLILIAHAVYADVQVRTSGPYAVLGRNLTWGGTIHNTWIMTPLNPDQGICIFVTNNDTNSHTFTLDVRQTGDPGVPQYTGFERFFRPDQIQGTYSPVAAQQTTTAFVHTSAAAKIAITISGSSGPGTANVYVVQTNAGSCGPVSAGTQYIQGSQPENSPPVSNPVLVAAKNYNTGNTSIPSVLTSSWGSTVQVVTNMPVCTDAQAVPTTLTTVYPFLVHAVQMWFANTTAAAISVTVQDRQATPVRFLSDISVAPNTTQLVAFAVPTKFAGGISWQASASGLNGQICIF